MCKAHASGNCISLLSGHISTPQKSKSTNQNMRAPRQRKWRRKYRQLEHQETLLARAASPRHRNNCSCVSDHSCTEEMTTLTTAHTSQYRHRKRIVKSMVLRNYSDESSIEENGSQHKQSQEEQVLTVRNLSPAVPNPSVRHAVHSYLYILQMFVSALVYTLLASL